MRTYCLLLCLVLFGTLAFSQAPVAKDPQGLSLLNTAVAAAGGQNAFDRLQDVTATGQITYYWAGKEVVGNVTIKIRGTDQYRVDAALPDGTRSWYVSGNFGELRDTKGKITHIPYHNVIGMRAMILPMLKLSRANSDANFSVAYKGLTTLQGQQFQEIQIGRLSGFNDSRGKLDKLADADIFVDPGTLHVVAVQDYTHPVNDLGKNIDHALYFSDYRSVNGLVLPFATTERMDGQRVSSIQVNSFSFNTGLSDSDFTF